mmetsp:Transcript_51103/g.122356  ORF Transcript_51103/g.122356 Transcript_51103/m.122356 type:complete len:111 (-) Transcript_51103:136-468(-)|eukprot:CAMPEP_0181472186 /NCGR_PEP_ID=MMETSP1110-20121109/39468_1 /TAXON_ID=174948 /ORGANISM="Symbiodinium sp., Strain CCMP421" /LENGTH=110 /DNA_ID=CAMNT_0023597243 /DNA_START=24 /DNA_END=356 /DNA_ORIENTATION=-
MSSVAMDCELSHEAFPVSRKRPVSDTSEIQVDHLLPLPSLSTATAEDVYKLLLLAEEQHLMRLRHYCEDALLNQSPDDLHGLKVAQRFGLGRLEERYRKRYAGGSLHSQY